MSRNVIFGVIIAVFVSVFPARAQEPDGRPAQGAFGLQAQDFWIYASQFKGRVTGRDLNYVQLGYWAAANTGVVELEAQVNLPAGAVINAFECFVFDADAGVDLTATFMRNEADAVSGTPGSNASIQALASSGSPGFAVLSQSGLNYTLKSRDGSNRFIHTVLLQIPFSGNVRFRGCRFSWHRSVSPAPGVATFADVPTNSGLFPFVEALVAAGITGGCGGGNYCPNMPVTRGQMAVFLSAALGLHWPN